MTHAADVKPGSLDDRPLDPRALDERSLDERSLDPSDWDAIRSLGHRMVDDMLDYVRDVRTRPAWQPLPDPVREQFARPAPQEGVGLATAYDEFQRYVLPYPAGNIHPRFWGWVKGAGTPGGMLADLLASAMNTNAWGTDQSASEVELQVVAWFRELFGFPAESSGILTTGGSVANLLGLCIARNTCSGYDAAGDGWPREGPRPRLYYSTETHNSIAKAVAVLGLGMNAARKVPVRDDFTIDVDALRAALASDAAAGDRPFCIVANVGTVNTGATDDLRALTALAREHGAWLHVDGAFGALAVLAPGHEDLRAALAEADSIAFDLHKWLSVPYDCGCVLVRDAAGHRAAFSPPASYLAPETRGASAGRARFNELGLELSRGFRALRAWMTIREHGFERLGAQVAKNVAQARALGAMIDAAPDLERLAPVAMNVVCFRARPAGVPEDALNALNREVLLRLQERGIAVPSGTTLRGRFAIRVANVNHRSTMGDFETLVDAVRAIAAEVVPASV